MIWIGGGVKVTYLRIFSSNVPLVTMRYTFTTFFCPMRCARSMAWMSFCGFQSCSTKMTVSAPVRLSPSPPTDVVSRSTSYDGSELNLFTMSCRRDASTDPSSRMYCTDGSSFCSTSVCTMSSISFI